MLLFCVIKKKSFDCSSLFAHSFTSSVVKFHQKQHQFLPTPPLGNTFVLKNSCKFKQQGDWEKLKVVKLSTAKTCMGGFPVRKQRQELTCVAICVQGEILTHLLQPPYFYQRRHWLCLLLIERLWKVQGQTPFSFLLCVLSKPGPILLYFVHSGQSSWTTS